MRLVIRLTAFDRCSTAGSRNLGNTTCLMRCNGSCNTRLPFHCRLWLRHRSGKCMALHSGGPLLDCFFALAFFLCLIRSS